MSNRLVNFERILKKSRFYRKKVNQKRKSKKYEVSTMKKKHEKNLIKFTPPSSVCQIIDDAIEERRQSEGTFDIKKHISRYNLADKESKEALVEELLDAIFLDDLFREFRDSRCRAASLPDQENWD